MLHSCWKIQLKLLKETMLMSFYKLKRVPLPKVRTNFDKNNSYQVPYKVPALKTSANLNCDFFGR